MFVLAALDNGYLAYLRCQVQSRTLPYRACEPLSLLCGVTLGSSYRVQECVNTGMHSLTDMHNCFPCLAALISFISPKKKHALITHT